VTREVWSAFEATVTFWEIDSSGIILSPAVRELSKGRKLSCRPIRRVKKFQQPGVGYEEVNTAIIGHEIRIGELFSRKSTQLTPFEDSTKRWRVLLQLVNPRYSGVAPLENDEADYRYAKVIDGPGFQFDEDGILETDLVLQAEWKA